MLIRQDVKSKNLLSALHIYKKIKKINEPHKYSSIAKEFVIGFHNFKETLRFICWCL